MYYFELTNGVERRELMSKLSIVDLKVIVTCSSKLLPQQWQAHVFSLPVWGIWRASLQTWYNARTRGSNRPAILKERRPLNTWSIVFLLEERTAIFEKTRDRNWSLYLSLQRQKILAGCNYLKRTHQMLLSITRKKTNPAIEGHFRKHANYITIIRHLQASW